MRKARILNHCVNAGYVIALFFGFFFGFSYAYDMGRESVINKLPEIAADKLNGVPVTALTQKDVDSIKTTSLKNTLPIAQTIAQKRIAVIKDTLKQYQQQQNESDNQTALIKKENKQLTQINQSNNDSNEIFKEVVYALMDRIDSLQNIADTRKTDTVYSFAKNPFLVNYYGTEKASKLGLGRNFIPLYGIKLQGLANYNLSLKTWSIGGGLIYDYNKLSFLLPVYYNISTNKFSISLNTRIDIKRF